MRKIEHGQEEKFKYQRDMKKALKKPSKIKE